MVSAVILTWNSARHIERCVASLAESARRAGEPLDIFIFDNGSTDGTPDILARLAAAYPQLAVERSPANTGTTRPRNIGVRRALARGSDSVLVLDADTEMAPDALAELARCLRADPAVGIVGARLALADGTLQQSCHRFPTLITKALRAASGVLRVGRAAARTLGRYDLADADRVFFPDYCISACWLVRREVFETAGLFDERIFYSPEDVDLCLRAWQAGFKVAYCPSAKVTHHTQQETYKKPAIAASHLKGLLYFFRKHGYWLSRRGLYRTMPLHAERAILSSK